MILSDLVQSTTATVPTSVTPPGWTLVGSVTGASSDGKGMRHNLSYKIMVGPEPGTTVAGMSGTGKSRKNLNTFRVSRPIQSVSVSGYDHISIAYGSSSYGLSIDPTSLPGNVISIIHMHCETTVLATPSGITGTSYQMPVDASDTYGSAGVARSFYSYVPIGGTLALNEVAMFDSGSFNFIAGANFSLS